MEIVTSWEERGIKKGLQQGLEQGRNEEALTLVNRLLTRRFGDLAQSVTEEVQLLPLFRLEQLAGDLLDFKTAADVELWLKESGV